MNRTSHRVSRADPRWARWLAIIGTVVVVAAVLIMTGLASVSKASATGGSGGPPAGTNVATVMPGAPCIGDEGNHGTKDGKPYLCWKKAGQDCARWHRVIVPGEPTGAWSPRPYASPCPNCSPTPTPPASTPPASASSAPPSSSASTPPDEGPQLPLTGTATAGLTGAGVLLLLVGFGMVRLSNNGARRR